MSKKLAMNADILVLDVKYGKGALMKTLAESRELAQIMAKIGRAAGKRVAALITSMEQPLGFAIGNALEVHEALAVLDGAGPEDLRTLSVALAGELLHLGGQAKNRAAGAELAAQLLQSGAAKCKFEQWIAAQGGMTDWQKLPQAPLVVPVYAEKSGYLAAIDTELLGLAALALGAGRQVKEAQIDPAVGIYLRHKLGDRVEAGETLAQLHCQSPESAQAALEMLRRAMTISDTAPFIAPLIAETV